MCTICRLIPCQGIWPSNHLTNLTYVTDLVIYLCGYRSCVGKGLTGVFMTFMYLYHHHTKQILTTFLKMLPNWAQPVYEWSGCSSNLFTNFMNGLQTSWTGQNRRVAPELCQLKVFWQPFHSEPIWQH